MKRNRIEKVLRETWPNGIPACDYSRAVGMVLSAGMALALEWDWNSAETSTEPERVKTTRSGYVPPSWKERVLNVMTGAEPLTQRQISERSGVHYTAVSRALRVLGARRVGESPRGHFGSPAGLYVLSDDSCATQNENA